ncbi:NLI interacting factor-like phosphatase, putative [Angomonas deanei]|uniref:Mitochondrial import inner membrane translocase subunit TIM50 n=1 Tax=Angomonas deanei TaxID=59799 RepID=A0A7G2CU15_9TRYP|nr:NLI interacting factor-like phosphatase, putative [Angomonas deanei]
MSTYITWLWQNIIDAYVTVTVVNLWSEGLDSFIHIYETLYVLCFFVFGRSHRDFPAPRSSLVTDAGIKTPRVEDMVEFGEGKAADDSDSDVVIQRRLLLGRKGEITEWYPALPGRPVVNDTSNFTLSKNLHQLVRKVIGLLRPFTAQSVLGGKHSPPVWPSHYTQRASDTVSVDTRAEEYSSSTNYTSANQISKRKRVYNRVNLNASDSKGKNTMAGISGRHVLTYPATRQKVLVIDLDETLCHVSTSTASMHFSPTFSEVLPTTSGAELYHVWERPYARLFLTTAAKFFNLVLFTSASPPYADTILKHIDPQGVLARRYYRQHCRPMSRGDLAKLVAQRRASDGRPGVLLSDRGTRGETTLVSSDGGHDNPLRADHGNFTDYETTDREDACGQSSTVETGSFSHRPKPVINENSKVLVKDLKILKVPPELLIMIDNSEECTLLNRENALIIPPYIPSEDRKETHDDEVLLGLISLLECLLPVPDVRSILRHGNLSV